VPRLTGHTYGEDPSAYKTEEEIKREKERDPVDRLRAFLGPDFRWDALQDEVESEIRAALTTARSQPKPERGHVTRHLFYSGAPPQVPEGGQGGGEEMAHQAPARAGPRVNFVEAVRRVMETELERNPRLLIFGEDVGARGGVHRATLDLQRRFGDGRVFDTSLSEEGIMGRSVGLSLAGLTPLPEIQFRKYADPATEQINDIGWVRWRTAGKFEAHIVVRIPVGFSRRTGDPWHSVCGEAIYAHTLGWRIAFPSNAEDAAGLLRAALRGRDPTIFLEHRALLDSPDARRPYPGDDFVLPYGQAAVRKEGRWLTVITWGEMVYRCLEAAAPFGEDVELIDLRTIIPWDQDAVLRSVQKTGRCLVVHEDSQTGGFAGEIVATLAEQAFVHLDAPVGRIATADCPIPYNRGLMEAVIPGVDRIREGMEGLLRW
jgi:2-oxoisovalerate dehydrogenase E1 component